MNVCIRITINRNNYTEYLGSFNTLALPLNTGKTLGCIDAKDRMLIICMVEVFYCYVCNHKEPGVFKLLLFWCMWVHVGACGCMWVHVVIYGPRPFV